MKAVAVKERRRIGRLGLSALLLAAGPALLPAVALAEPAACIGGTVLVGTVRDSDTLTLLEGAMVGFLGSPLSYADVTDSGGWFCVPNVYLDPSCCNGAASGGPPASSCSFDVTVQRLGYSSFSTTITPTCNQANYYHWYLDPVGCGTVPGSILSGSSAAALLVLLPLALGRRVARRRPS